MIRAFGDWLGSFRSTRLERPARRTPAGIAADPSGAGAAAPSSRPSPPPSAAAQSRQAERSGAVAERPPSLARRLAITIALILSASGVVVTLAAYAYGREAAEAAYDRLLAGAAFQIAQSISVSADRLAVDLPVSAFELLALATDDRVVYRVIDRNGATVTGYDDVQPPANPSGDLSFYTSRFGAETVRLAATRRRFAEQAYSGDVEVVVGHTTRARDALARDIATKAMLLVLAAGLVIAALTLFAVRSSLAPLARIEAALAARDPKDLSPLSVSTPREVEALVAAINRFMDRLQRRVTGMQTLIADTAHQLRTPIAALRAQAQLAGEESDPAALKTIAEKIERRAIGLGRLADQLLNQALVVHRGDAQAAETLDLREVAMQVADAVDELLPASRLRLALPEEPVLVAGDGFSLAEAVKNLVNNAFAYGVEPVSLVVEVRDGAAEIAVIDHGPGIPDPGAAGRRFARASSSGGGAGIGLAIVDAVAASHQGSLVLSTPPAGGFRAALRLARVGAPA